MCNILVVLCICVVSFALEKKKKEAELDKESREEKSKIELDKGSKKDNYRKELIHCKFEDREHYMIASPTMDFKTASTVVQPDTKKIQPLGTLPVQLSVEFWLLYFPSNVLLKPD